MNNPMRIAAHRAWRELFRASMDVGEKKSSASSPAIHRRDLTHYEWRLFRLHTPPVATDFIDMTVSMALTYDKSSMRECALAPSPSDQCSCSSNSSLCSIWNLSFLVRFVLHTSDIISSSFFSIRLIGYVNVLKSHSLTNPIVDLSKCKSIRLTSVKKRRSSTNRTNLWWRDGLLFYSADCCSHLISDRSVKRPNSIDIESVQR